MVLGYDIFNISIHSPKESSIKEKIKFQLQNMHLVAQFYIAHGRALFGNRRNNHLSRKNPHSMMLKYMEYSTLIEVN
jgi:hypothetical protein